MTKLIGVLIVVAVLFVGWLLLQRWDEVQQQKDLERKQAAASVVTEESLSGMPYQLQQSLQAARNQGAEGLKNWLKTYDRNLQDPRKAWIQLDYCVLISRENPAEAKRLFAEIKGRLPQSSPVWPRVKQLEKTYE
jgi:hypothetical protein